MCVYCGGGGAESLQRKEELVMEVVVHTGEVLPEVSEVVVEVEGASVTCGELLDDLLSEYEQDPSRRGAWLMEEEWNGCRHALARTDLVPIGGVVTLHLRRRDRSELLVQKVKQKQASRNLGSSFVRAPHSFLSRPRVLSSRELRCVEAVLRRKLDTSHRRYSATLLQRLAGRELLWGPPAPAPLDALLSQLSALQQENLKYSTELSDMNIENTRLQGQVGVVTKKAGQLSGELGGLQAEVQRRKEERARNAPKNIEQMRTDLEKLAKELETKNQVNNALNSKLQKVKDHLKVQRVVLEERKKEIDKLKGWGSDTSHDHGRTTKHVQKTSHPSLAPPIAPAFADRAASVPLTTPPSKRATPSSSRKRHANIIEARSRQLVEEEGHTFKQQQTKQHQEGVASDRGVWLQEKGSGRKESSPIITTSRTSSVLDVPQPDPSWYEEKGMASTAPTGSCQADPKERGRASGVPSASSGGGKGRGRKVHFDAKGIILSAALEGNLDLLKECVRKVGGCGYSNDKGATCLHNAVCSGNFEAVSYLVDLSCDINAQDIDGWTPLHCAVAYSNLEIVRYLVEHGASMFLATRDGDTPLNIAEEEHKLLKEEGQSNTLEMAAKCLEYLKKMERGLGRVNGGVVFALFSREEEEEGELTIQEGERLRVLTGPDEGKWWKVRNGQGREGEVPSSFLGPYKHTRDTL